MIHTGPPGAYHIYFYFPGSLIGGASSKTDQRLLSSSSVHSVNTNYAKSNSDVEKSGAGRKRRSFLNFFTKR